VAGFVGRAGGLRGTLAADSGVRIGGDGIVWRGVPTPDVAAAALGTPVELVVRPESLTFAQSGLEGRVTERRYSGAATYYQVELARSAGGGEIEVQAPADAAAEGDAVRVGLLPGGLPPRIFRLDKNLQVGDNPAASPRVSDSMPPTLRGTT
jgi:ABC-type Fe3+/spermidine/putrescine transport system ATPase subunit